MRLTLHTKAMAFGRRFLGSGRRLRSLRKFFAMRDAQGLKALPPARAQNRSPNYLGLGVKSDLSKWEHIDENIRHLLGGGSVPIPGKGSPHLNLTPAMRRAAEDWQYGVGAMTLNPAGQRRRLAKVYRDSRKEQGHKAVRERLKRVGMEYRKYSI